MLLRFLTLATASVTYLSMQALSSTETKSQRLSATSAFSTANIIDLPTSKQLLLQAKFQATQSAFPPLPKSIKIQRLKHKSKQKLLKAKKARIVKKRTLKARQKKLIRLSYLPPSYKPQKIIKSTVISKKKTVKKEKIVASLTPQKKAVQKLRRRGPKPKYSLGARAKVKYKKRIYKKTYATKRKKRYKRRVHYRPRTFGFGIH